MEEIDRSISSCVIAILYKMILYHIKTYCTVYTGSNLFWLHHCICLGLGRVSFHRRLHIQRKGSCSEDEERLVRDLFRGYNKLVRPVKNMSMKVDVKFGLTFTQLISVVSQINMMVPRYDLDLCADCAYLFEFRTRKIK